MIAQSSILVVRSCLLLTLATMLAAAEVPRRGEAVLVPEERQLPHGDIERRSLMRRDGKYPLRRAIERVRPQADKREHLVASREMVADHLLVTYRPGTTPAQMQEVARRAGATVRRRIGTTRTLLLAFPVRDHATHGDMVRRLAAQPGVLAAEPDEVIRVQAIPNDTFLPYQWALANQSVPGADINAPAAWDHATGNRRVVVGVIDSGIDYGHPDLVANLWLNRGESGVDAQGRDRRSNGLDDDGNGYVDDWRGWNFVGDDNDPLDDHGHGTHCAGIIGAVGNNGSGTTGVCWQVSLAALKFIGPDGSGYMSDAIAALDYATTAGIRITSNSYRSYGIADVAMRDAIARAEAQGGLFVCAAGNDSTDIDATPVTPGSLDNPNLISVASTGTTDVLSSFSNTGFLSVDLAAPGEGIWSTLPGQRHGVQTGTSMACPQVAGAAALLWSVAPEATPAQLKNVLLASVDQRPSLIGNTVTGGRLDVGNAMALIRTGPRLNAGTPVIVDAPLIGGNGNGVLEPGEVAEVSVPLVNIGTQSATLLRASLLVLSADILVETGELSLGTIAPGVATTAGPFRLSLGALASTGQVEAVLRLADDAGGQWDIPCPLVIDQTGRIAGTVTDLVSGAALSGFVHYQGPSSGRVSVSGSYALTNLPSGTYTVWAKVSGRAESDALTVTVPPGSDAANLRLGTPRIAVTPTMVAISVREDATETLAFTLSNPGNLPLQVQAAAAPAPGTSTAHPGLWHQTQVRQFGSSPTWRHALSWPQKTSPSVPVGGLVFSGITVPIDSPMLSWWCWAESACLDLLIVEVSTDGGATWAYQTATVVGTSAGQWRQQQLHLGAFANQRVAVRFRVTSQSSTGTFEGTYLSEVVMAGNRLMPCWSFAPATLTIPPASSAVMALTVAGHSLNLGTNRLTVMFTSNDPTVLYRPVPVTVSVTSGSRLQQTAVTYDDGAADGDGRPEMGETVTGLITVTNVGMVGSLAQSGVITCPDPYLTLIDQTCTVPALAPGESTTIPVRMQIAPECPYNQQITVSLTLSNQTSLGFTFTVWRWHSLTGTIRDAASGQPLAGATIATTNEGEPVSTISGADGSYRIDGFVFPGYHHVDVTHPERSPVSENVPFDSADVTVWDATLGTAVQTITPAAVSVRLKAGRTTSVPLTISNPGNVPLRWTMTEQYRAITSDEPGGPAFSWIDIATTGEVLLQGPYWSALSRRTMGNVLPLYGRFHDAFYLDSQGMVLLDYSPALVGGRAPLPSTSVGRNLLAGCWGELGMGGDSQVTMQHIDGTTIFQFDRLATRPIATAPTTFQMRLQPDGRIVFAYQRVAAPDACTVGIQNHDGTRGVLISHNQPRIHDHLAVHFIPGGAWWEVVNAAGTIAPGAAQTTDLLVSAVGLAPGVYHDTLRSASNAWPSGTTDVPLTLEVVTNTAPVATNQAVPGFPEDTSTTIRLVGSDADGDALTFRIVSSPAHGSVSGTAPDLVYTPVADYHGPDEFTFVVNDGEVDSAPATVTLVVSPVDDPVPYQPGLLAEFFDFTSALSVIPTLTGRTPTVVRSDAQIAYPSTGGTWAGLPGSMADTFASRHTGWLKIDTAGSYTLSISSDDGSRVYLDGALLINNDGLHGMQERSATLTLVPGFHHLRVEFFENAGGAGLEFRWTGPGISKQLVPASALWHTPVGVAAVPLPWSTLDIGAVGMPGAAIGDGDDFSVFGGGADIWGTADAFRMVQRPLLGNGELIARVAAVQNTDVWAKAGVMVRASNAANSVNAFIAITPGNGATFQVRAATGGASTSVKSAGKTAPYWVRLVRTGTSVSGWISADGTTWVQVGATVTIPLGTTPVIGLGVTGHNNAVRALGIFEQVVWIPYAGG